MQIVIDLSDEEYEKNKKNRCDYHTLCMAIKNGIPLPKNHGDLIDRRDLKKEVYTTTEWNGDIHRIIYEASIDDAPTIIEADRSDSK